ncbi:glycosyltransferase family 2 protein [Marinobacter sp.]|uniref:glycosyltransferase family 2 protein n=1 Tax=Marinobacter sp. TaxID=50741 RepID=UPI0035647EF7
MIEDRDKAEMRPRDWPKAGERPPLPPAPRQEDEITKYWKGEADTPLVSILCHCFNHEPFVKDALHGFLAQKTDFPFEIVVHDDASNDKTAQIIKEYAERYPRIVKPIYQTQNQYSLGLRPAAYTMPAAKGQYFAFCEGDDYWLDPNKLQTQTDFLRLNPDYSVCGHDAFIFQGHEIIKESKLPERLRKDYSPKRLQRGPFLLTLTLVFRADYDQIPPEHFKVVNGDKFMVSRLGQIGGYKHLGKIFPAAHRWHEGGVWSLQSEEIKAFNHIQTFYWMAVYYRRQGNARLSSFFSDKASIAAKESLMPLSMRALLWLLFKLFRANIKRLMRKSLES